MAELIEHLEVSLVDRKSLSFEYTTEQGQTAAMCREGNEYLVIERINVLHARGASMTPQEELFAKLFSHEKILVKEMSDADLRTHRDELSQIAFEAKARLTAVHDEEKDRKPKGPGGFRRSLQTDDITSNAINSITERKKKMSVDEKLLASLVSIGFTEEAARERLAAGKILSNLRQQGDILPADASKVFTNTEEQSKAVDSAKLIEAAEAQAAKQIEESKKVRAFVNPFEKKG